LYLREGANRRWRTLIIYTRPRNEKFHRNVRISSDITEIETRGEFHNIVGRWRERITVLEVSVKKTRRNRTL
jgi:hypothetical protein